MPADTTAGIEPSVNSALPAEIESLRRQLQEANDTLSAIRNGEVDAVVVSGADNSSRVYTLETADRSYRRLVEEMSEGALTVTATGRILYCNPRFAQLVGRPPTQIMSASLEAFVAPADWQRLLETLKKEGAGDFELRGASGEEVSTHISFNELLNSQGDEPFYCCIVTDLTERRLSENALRGAHDQLLSEVAEREKTEQLLRQSQKMEAVGQLTGGLAHDFNNLLMGIMGSLEMMRNKLDQGRVVEIERYIDVACGAGRRAAALTQRLLAFARRQTLDPQATNVNRLVAGMEELIRRSIGPLIHLEVVGAGGLWNVLVDAPQLENALLNICINARDAMPGGGRLTIETANKWR